MRLRHLPACDKSSRLISQSQKLKADSRATIAVAKRALETSRALIASVRRRPGVGAAAPGR